MNRVSRGLAALILTVAVAVSLAGCAKRTPPEGALSGTVTASGSTALLHLASAAKELFEEQHEWVTVNISGGGSFNGLNQVSTGAVQIGNSDVEAPPDKYPGLVDHKVAVAPFVLVTNTDVAVENVSMEQLAAILRGEITNWSEVGGPSQPITVVSRQQSSGSRATIVATVLKGEGDITRDALIQDSNGKVRDGVISTPGSIGYVDAPYYDPEKMKALKIDGTAYSVEAVATGQWPIYAYEHMYTRGEPSGVTKAYLDFVLSPAFQDEYVEQLGFVPVTRMQK
ncbi:MAG TPA: phosphate ABC transporter substrate-binding protein [Symbiobacteriaceae bacterium]|nr:phosphate ABC transporter substrate-binding protein [Symbiobacteriaceae bacterium]